MRSSNRTRYLIPGVAILLGIAAGTLCSASAQGLPDLSGVWVFAQVTAETVELPFVGARTRYATTLVRTILVQDGDEITAHELTCASRIDYGTNLVKTIIPPGFLESLGVNERPGSVSWSDRDGDAVVELVLPWDAQVAGARLDDPEADPLPTQADDPRVIDQDADGHPGVSVHVEILGLIQGDVYVTQRNWTRLVGVLIAADTIRGTIEWRAEQTVLGATSSWLAQDQLGTPDLERSFFIAKRISAGLDCAQIEALDLLTPFDLDRPDELPPSGAP
jgi:hypothetical protein